MGSQSVGHNWETFTSLHFQNPQQQGLPQSFQWKSPSWIFWPILFLHFLQGKFILFFLSTERILRMSMVVTVRHFHFKMCNDIFFLKAIHKNNYNTFIHSRTISVQTQVSPGGSVYLVSVDRTLFLPPVLAHSDPLMFLPQWIARARGMGCSDEPGLIPPQAKGWWCCCCYQKKGDLLQQRA